jgi:hypothetical protein
MSDLLKPWEFVIGGPGDLGPFADLLAEWGHPGEQVVRNLIANGKFPEVFNTGYGGQFWCWRLAASIYDGNAGDHAKLPRGAMREDHKVCYFTATEAIWGVVNADRYV